MRSLIDPASGLSLAFGVLAMLAGAAQIKRYADLQK